MTCPINIIADNKHRQLASQVGGVVKISSAGLMAPCNINTVTFIPGKEFTFGSFNFVASIDGRLHVFDSETNRTGRIKSDLASHIITRPVSESNSARLENRIILPRYLFGFCNSANTYQYMLRQIMEPQPEHEMDSGKEQGE